jgi:hypothetical protein
MLMIARSWIDGVSGGITNTMMINGSHDDPFLLDIFS